MCRPAALSGPRFGRRGVCLLKALLSALRCLAVWFRRGLLTRLCFASCAVRVCVAVLLGVCVTVLLELTELAKPVEMPCLRTHSTLHRVFPFQHRTSKHCAAGSKSLRFWSVRALVHSPDQMCCL